MRSNTARNILRKLQNKSKVDWSTFYINSYNGSIC